MKKYFTLLATIGALFLIGAGCTDTIANSYQTPVTSPVQVTTASTAHSQSTDTQPLETPPSAPSNVFHTTLSYGSSGTAVANVQQFLADEGLYFGRDSGIFDQSTTDAVIKFEQQQNINPSGIWGSAEEATANTIIVNHPDWLTALSNNNEYKNVNGSTVKSPSDSNNGIPAGATAICRDGTYSFSMHRRGTCSYHGGVASWLN